MTELRIPHVWILLPNGSYYRLAAGITKLREHVTAQILEIPTLFSSVSAKEPIRYEARLEYEGYRLPTDPANRWICDHYLDRGDAAKTSVVICNINQKMAENKYVARKFPAALSASILGCGDGTYGCEIAGSLIYLSDATKGTFHEVTKTFTPDEE